MPQTSPAPVPAGSGASIFQKELSLGELFSTAWNLFTKNFSIIIMIVLLVYLPVNIISSLLSVEPASFSDSLRFGIDTHYDASRIGLYSLLNLLAQTLATLAIAYIVNAIVTGQKADFKSALKKSASRLLPALGTGLLLGIFLFFLSLLLVIPGIIFAVFWAFSIFAVILSDKSGMDALNYSKSLVKGRWWKIFLYFIVFGILYTVLSWILNAIFPNNNIINVIYSTLLNLVFTFFVIVASVLYLNLQKLRQSSPAVQ